MAREAARHVILSEAKDLPLSEATRPP